MAVQTPQPRSPDGFPFASRRAGPSVASGGDMRHRLQALLWLILASACGAAPTTSGGDGGPTMTRDSGPPQPPPRACDGLAAAGVWEDIDPPELRSTRPGPMDCPYGGDFVIDPNDGATIYLGSCEQGIWKSIDCGASWVHINTGRNGA